MQSNYDSLGNVEGSGTQRGSLKRRLDSRIRKIQSIDGELTDLYEEKKIYREKKVRPGHQLFTRQFIDELYQRYQDVCDRVGVEFVRSRSVLDFDGLVIDYAHSRHSTWNPVRSRDSQIIKSIHGKLDSFAGIDVLLESGHFGIGYKQLQKMRDSPSETNFKNQSSYDSDTDDSHLTVVLALPFEDQASIGAYAKGRKSARMSGGKPMNTRKIAAMDRFNNDGVSGLTILTKDPDGVGTEWIQYGNFVDGSALAQPEQYALVYATSDEHIAAPESNPLVLDGSVALYRRLLEGDAEFRGRPARAVGFMNGGDVAEANSKKWDHRYHHKRNPHDVLQENIRLLKDFRPESVDDVIALAMKMTDDAMGGSVESMKVVLDWVADYYDRYLDPTLESSSLRWAHVSTTGNHADAILRDVGLKEYDFFLQRLKARGIGAYEVGVPDYFHKHASQKGRLDDARVFLGGYSNARVLQIPDYGLDTDGNAVFGPLNIVLQHDPKGSDMIGVIGSGRNAGADVSLAGHTHDNRLKLYRTENNCFGVAYKLATLQGVSPTEKYYAGSVPRTQASQCLCMPMRGDFSEKAIPVRRLREEGMKALLETAADGLGGKDGR
ncbi:TPA: hypothetical protein HA265_00415 [Candidatus Woesearchaeota archaeon]|nr:hypothetical protein [Candidatus Woesearchaeota archaeon]